MIRVPDIIDINNPLIAQSRVLAFSVYCSPQEANSPDREAIITKKMKELEGYVGSNGYVMKIERIERVMPGQILTRVFNGFVKYTVYASCRVYNPQIGDVIMNCRVFAKEDGMIALRPTKNNGVIIMIPEIHLTEDLYKKITIDQVENIECVSVDALLRTSEFLATGKIAPRIYDIPVLMRHLDMSVNAGEIAGEIHLEMFDGKENTFLPQLGYDGEMDISESVWSEWEKKYKYLLNPYELLEGRKTYVPKKLDVKVNIYDEFPYPMPELPVSRAYFKVVEVVYRFSLNKLVNDKSLLVSLADAPGGFAQAFSHMFPKTRILTTSIRDKTGEQIPYSPVIVGKKNIKIDYLATDTGNLTAVENIRYLAQKYGEQATIVACDGAFDHDSYPGIEKEVLHHQLLFAEIVASLVILGPKGCACWKLYTRFTDANLRLIAWIAQFFEKCYVYKPRAVRMANSESFIVCTGFYGLGDYPIEKLYAVIAEMGSQVRYSRFVRKLITIPVSEAAAERLRNYNRYLSDWQLFVFRMTMSLMQSGERKEDYIVEQIEYAKNFLKFTE